eukprot:5346001-Amphidinium_carterae.1
MHLMRDISSKKKVGVLLDLAGLLLLHPHPTLACLEKSMPSRPMLSLLLLLCRTDPPAPCLLVSRPAFCRTLVSAGAP